MDRGKWPSGSRFVANKNNKIYMDLRDIIREHALPFLPAKSLFRFTAVCKEWKLLISRPFFAHKQSNSCHQIAGFFSQSEGGSISFISLDPRAYGVPDPTLNFLPEPVDLRASSNGLLCCQGRNGDKHYYICNPVTKQFKKLPKPNADHGFNPALVLIFEPSLLNFTAEYKLVCAFASADFDDGLEFEIYDSTKGSWRISGEIFFGNRHVQPWSGVHADGIVCWKSKMSTVIAFDLQMERAQLIYGGHGYLSVMNGKFSLTKVKGYSITVDVLSNAYVNTMQMNSNVKAWERKRSINLDFFMTRGASHDQVLSSGDVVVIRSGDSLYACGLMTKETTLLCSGISSSARLVPYANSLVEI